MLELRRRKMFLRIREVYFSDRLVDSDRDADITCFIQSRQRALSSEEFRTLVIDLRDDEDGIYMGFRKNTRYEISRAQKSDGFGVEVNEAPTSRDIAQFVGFYDEFARETRVGRANRGKLEALSGVGALVLSCVSDPQGEALVRHAYVCDRERARLLYSASYFRRSVDPASRALIGRANRLLHWEDMRFFRRQGFAMYDLGGISSDLNNTEQQNINKFKESFGGVELVEYKTYTPNTLIGTVALRLARLGWSVRKRRLLSKLRSQGR